jgi:hypothetical protein
MIANERILGPRQQAENVVFEGTIFGHLLQSDISRQRGISSFQSIALFTNVKAPQEKTIGLLKNRNKVLVTGRVSKKNIGPVTWLACAFDNLNDFSDILIDNGYIDRRFGDEDWVNNHKFFQRDVLKIRL